MVNIILTVIAPVVLVLGIVGALLPYIIIPPGSELSPLKALLLSIGNCFCGGVLLATGLLHMVPDEMEAAEELGQEHPIPEIFITVGFLSLVIIEYSGVVQWLVSYYKNKGHGHSHDINENLLGESSPNSNVTLEATSLLDGSKDINIQKYEDNHEGHHEHHHHHYSDGHHDDGHHHHHEFVVNGTVPVLLTLILCCHSVFEGLSLGSSEQESTIISLSIAICFHRIFEAFALGACCRKADVSYCKAIAGVIVYSIVSPLCMYIGFLAKNYLEGNGKLWIEMIFQGCAAGTFLHIAILEIIAEEGEDGKNLFWKLCGIIAGSVMMGGLAFLV